MDQDVVASMVKEGLRRFAKAVVVVTTRQDGVRHAMAATAVSEISMNPPSMLVCVNKTASIHPILAGGADFCINILDAAHTHLSRACSGAAKGEARFEIGDWAETDLGIPRLADAQASFVCRNSMETVFGTHSIFIGEVVEAFVATSVNPLIYVDGRYTRTGSDIED